MTKKPETVGVRELRQNLSVYLRRVKEGETLAVTERGQVVAQLTPAPEPEMGILERMIADYGADGVVFHPINSCRTVSTGLADSRRSLLSRLDTATLFIESDHMDRRVVSEAQLKNRVDAFFEGLATRKRQSVIAGTAASAATATNHPGAAGTADAGA